jgi:hypothetical protein
MSVVSVCSDFLMQPALSPSSVQDVAILIVIIGRICCDRGNLG